MKNFVNSLILNYQKIEQSFRTANKKLNHLDQRVEFAKNRLGVIKALYSSKREEIQRANILDLSSIHGSINPIVQNEEKISHLNQEQDNLELIKSELNKVQTERDLLATKLQNDMQTMNEKLKSMKEEYELIIQTLNKELKELREINELKQEQIEEASKQLLEKGGLYEDLNRKYEELNAKFNELKNELNSDHERSLRERESQFMDKMAKMNEKLNEARREQAKAVVLMRQMERSTNREKERMENLLKSCDNYYKEHVKKLQTKVNSLEKEKNILMNSLRQQGSLFNFSNTSADLAVNVETKAILGASSSSISPGGFAIENWLEKNSKKSELTSFWLDSKQNEADLSDDEIIVEQETQMPSSSLENDQKEQDLQEDISDSARNDEILQQIRRIMGNLELSDVEDEPDEDEEQNYEEENEQKYFESVKGILIDSKFYFYTF